MVGHHRARARDRSVGTSDGDHEPVVDESGSKIVDHDGLDIRESNRAAVGKRWTLRGGAGVDPRFDGEIVLDETRHRPVRRAVELQCSVRRTSCRLAGFLRKNRIGELSSAGGDPRRKRKQRHHAEVHGHATSRPIAAVPSGWPQSVASRPARRTTVRG